MNDADKVIEYELQIADMLQTLQARLNELEGMPLDDFDRGRHLAYTEMMEIIRTRHAMILDVIEEN